MTLNIFKQTFTPRYKIILLIILQFFSVLFLAVGFSNIYLVWFLFILHILFIFFHEEYFSILLIIANLPLYLAVPIKTSVIPEWRILFLVLFFVWSFRNLKKYLNFSSFSLFDFFVAIKKLFWGTRSFVWDKYLVVFFVVASLSTLWAHYPIQSLKQVFFWLNIAFLYFLISQVVKTKEQVIEVIKFSAFSLCLTVLTGYFQLLLSFVLGLDLFWVYWASFVSKIYYGVELSKVLLYSNSWFSYTGGNTELRMFSIMPDSHSFAMLCVFAMTFLLPLIYLYRGKTEYKLSLQSCRKDEKGKWHLFDSRKKSFGVHINYVLWSAIRFCGLAVILSGTRAVWVGLLLPLFLTVVGYFSNFLKGMAKRVFWPYIIIIFFFAVSPLINQGLHILRASQFQERFLERFSSSFNLKEPSNMGRLEIWKSSLEYAYKHPFGTGLGNFAVTQIQPEVLSQSGGKPNFQTLSESHNKRYNLPQKYVTAHNLYLHLLVEVSIVGLVAFLFFWLVYFKEMEKFVSGKRFTDNFFAFFVVETGLTFLWFLASAVFDVTFFNDKVLIYFFISLALSKIIIQNYSSFEKNA